MKQAYLYYLAAFFALLAALVSFLRRPEGEGVSFHVVFLLMMTTLLVWLGSRSANKPRPRD
jgi:hypothetical protein